MADPEATRRQLLTLDIPDLREKTARLFTELTRNSEVRARFIHSPAQVVASHLAPDIDFGDDHLSETNRLLFALMANDGFRRWAELYQGEVSRKIAARGEAAIDRDEIRREFRQAVVRFATPEIVAALTADRALTDELGPGPISVIIVKAETYAFASTWVVYKVSGAERGETVINPADLRSLAEEVATRAKNLSDLGRLTDAKARFR